MVKKTLGQCKTILSIFFFNSEWTETGKDFVFSIIEFGKCRALLNIKLLSVIIFRAVKKIRWFACGIYDDTPAKQG